MYTTLMHWDRLTMPEKPTRLVGRGSHFNPPSRFDATVLERDLSQCEESEHEYPRREPTIYLPDASQSVVSTNDSPDLAFRYSLNPYRGCAHGCSYCYARTYHEFLGLSGGLDFESRIFFKPQAAQLFRDFLRRPRWSGCRTGSRRSPGNPGAY